MKVIVKNIRSMWKAAKQELGEFGKGWQEVEEYWKEHPETRVEFLHM